MRGWAQQLRGWCQYASQPDWDSLNYKLNISVQVRVLTRERGLWCAAPPAVMCLWLWPPGLMQTTRQTSQSAQLWGSCQPTTGRKSPTLQMVKEQDYLITPLTPKQPPVAGSRPRKLLLSLFLILDLSQPLSISPCPLPVPVIDWYLPVWLHQNWQNVVLILSKFPFSLVFTIHTSHHPPPQISKIL